MQVYVRHVFKKRVGAGLANNPPTGTLGMLVDLLAIYTIGEFKMFRRGLHSTNKEKILEY